MTKRQEYKVLQSFRDFEVREYLPCVLAQVKVSANYESASSMAFAPLFKYISQGNKTSEKIAMTAPVTLSAAQQGGDMSSANKWRVHFVMPGKYTMTNIPLPNNAEVKLREIPGKLFAVHSFTGFNSVSRVQTKSDELLAWLQSKNFKPLSSVQLSRYDPPWTLPMFRRNEIMVEIEQ